MTNLDMRNVPDHYPERGDQVHLWLQDFLKFHTNDQVVQGPASRTVKRLIAEYEEAADGMISLENVVNFDMEDDAHLLDRPKKKPKWEQRSPKEGPEF